MFERNNVRRPSGVLKVAVFKKFVVFRGLCIHNAYVHKRYRRRGVSYVSRQPASRQGASILYSILHSTGVPHPLLGPYSRTIPRALWWSLGGGLFLVSEVPLYHAPVSCATCASITHVVPERDIAGGAQLLWQRKFFFERHAPKPLTLMARVIWGARCRWVGG